MCGLIAYWIVKDCSISSCQLTAATQITAGVCGGNGDVGGGGCSGRGIVVIDYDGRRVSIFYYSAAILIGRCVIINCIRSIR